MDCVIPVMTRSEVKCEPQAVLKSKQLWLFLEVCYKESTMFCISKNLVRTPDQRRNFHMTRLLPSTTQHARKATGDSYERKAKSDLEGRGYTVINANATQPNCVGYDLIIERSNGSQVLISVKSTTQASVPIATGTLVRNSDGSYKGADKVAQKLLPGAFTIAYQSLKGSDCETVYIVPHDVIKPLFPLWLRQRRGGKHTFTLNPTSAAVIGLDLSSFENAWHFLPTP
jgi:hypothetical protein